MTAAQERRDIDMNGDSNDNQLDINSDEIFEVFGPDSSNHVRGVGSHIPRKHLQQVAVATEILEQESSKSVAKVEADVCEVKASVTTMQGVLTVSLVIIMFRRAYGSFDSYINTLLTPCRQFFSSLPILGQVVPSLLQQ